MDVYQPGKQDVLAFHVLPYLVRFPEHGVICELSLLLVLFSAPRGFSLGAPGFSLLQEPIFPNSNSNLILTRTFLSEFF